MADTKLPAFQIFMYSMWPCVPCNNQTVVCFDRFQYLKGKFNEFNVYNIVHIKSWINKLRDRDKANK